MRKGGWREGGRRGRREEEQGGRREGCGGTEGRVIKGQEVSAPPTSPLASPIPSNSSSLQDLCKCPSATSAHALGERTNPSHYKCRSRSWKKVTLPKSWGGGGVADCPPGLLTPHPVLFLLYNMNHAVTKACSPLNPPSKSTSSRKSRQGLPDLLQSFPRAVTQVISPADLRQLLGSNSDDLPLCPGSQPRAGTE